MTPMLRIQIRIQIRPWILLQIWNFFQKRSGSYAFSDRNYNPEPSLHITTERTLKRGNKKNIFCSCDFNVIENLARFKLQLILYYIKIKLFDFNWKKKDVKVNIKQFFSFKAKTAFTAIWTKYFCFW